MRRCGFRVDSMLAQVLLKGLVVDCRRLRRLFLSSLTVSAQGVGEGLAGLTSLQVCISAAPIIDCWQISKGMHRLCVGLVTVLPSPD